MGNKLAKLAKLALRPEDLDNMDFYRLMAAREQADAAGNAQLAPYEHQAYARELTQDNPLNALGLAVAAPAYYAAKQPALIGLAQRLGLVGGNATPADLEQLKRAYRGIYQGLTTKAPTPYWKR